MPLLCTYRLNWARRTSWGWWDITLPSTYRILNSNPGSMRPSSLPLGQGGSPTILNLYEWAGKKHFVTFLFYMPWWDDKHATLSSRHGIRTLVLWGRALHLPTLPIGQTIVDQANSGLVALLPYWAQSRDGNPLFATLPKIPRHSSHWERNRKLGSCKGHLSVDTLPSRLLFSIHIK